MNKLASRRNFSLISFTTYLNSQENSWEIIALLNPKICCYARLARRLPFDLKHLFAAAAHKCKCNEFSLLSWCWGEARNWFQQNLINSRTSRLLKAPFLENGHDGGKLFPANIWFSKWIFCVKRLQKWSYLIPRRFINQ